MTIGEPEQIAVTAPGMEKRLQDVPVSVTVYNQQQLTDRNVVTAGYVATYTPSFSASTQFEPDNTTVSIRGFTQENRTAAPVAVNFAGPGGACHAGATFDRGPCSFFSLITARF
ncbi:MAG: TonB-dependent receptor plug domain-containing protein [Rhizomicrobium sp.]